jgi:hypothetical protein
MKAASQAQVDYAKRLLAQQGREPPGDDVLKAMNDVEIGGLLNELLEARGKPVRYGNGQFMRWQRD